MSNLNLLFCHGRKSCSEMFCQNGILKKKFCKFNCGFYRKVPMFCRKTTLLNRGSLYKFTYLTFLAVQSVTNIIEKHKSPSSTTISYLDLIFCNAGSSHPDMFCQSAVKKKFAKFNLSGKHQCAVDIKLC